MVVVAESNGEGEYCFVAGAIAFSGAWVVGSGFESKWIGGEDEMPLISAYAPKQNPRKQENNSGTILVRRI